MPRRPITHDWTIDLDEAFQRRTDGGDVMFWLPPRTVYATVFATDDVEAEEAIGKMLEGRPGEPVRTFDRLEPGLAGHAYLLPEGEGRGRGRAAQSFSAPPRGRNRVPRRPSGRPASPRVGARRAIA